MNLDLTSRNPYHVEGLGPRLRQSVLAYCDILGYRQMVEASYATGTCAFRTMTDSDSGVMADSIPAA